MSHAMFVESCINICNTGFDRVLVKLDAKGALMRAFWSKHRGRKVKHNGVKTTWVCCKTSRLKAHNHKEENMNCRCTNIYNLSSTLQQKQNSST